MPWHVYCPWVSAAITHLTCAVSDLHPLLPPLSSHFLQIAKNLLDISFILQCVLCVGCDNIAAWIKVSLSRISFQVPVLDFGE